jgi:hypothetical protein
MLNRDGIELRQLALDTHISQYDSFGSLTKRIVLRWNIDGFPRLP